MPQFPHPGFDERVRASFALQNAMALIKATMPVVERKRAAAPPVIA